MHRLLWPRLPSATAKRRKRRWAMVTPTTTRWTNVSAWQAWKQLSTPEPASISGNPLCRVGLLVLPRAVLGQPNDNEQLHGHRESSSQPPASLMSQGCPTVVTYRAVRLYGSCRRPAHNSRGDGGPFGRRSAPALSAWGRRPFKNLSTITVGDVHPHEPSDARLRIVGRKEAEGRPRIANEYNLHATTLHQAPN